MNDSTLPPPLVPAEVDLRDTPIPAHVLVDLACSMFGVSRDEAWKMVLEVAASTRTPISGLDG